MKSFLFLLGGLSLGYACQQLSARPPAQTASLPVSTKEISGELRVGRAEADQMRRRRGKDDAVFKIAASDLAALMTNGPQVGDSLVFFLAQYQGSSASDKKRYLLKRPKADWNEVLRKPSTVLVGLVPGAAGNLVRGLTPRQGGLPIVRVYDLAVLCPPPANCGCEVEQ